MVSLKWHHQNQLRKGQIVSHQKNPPVLTRTRCWTAVFAFRPLSSSYLCRLYWAFHFLCLWLNIQCSKLSSDIRQGVRFNFEVSERLFKLKCLPLLLSLICIGCASKHCSQFLSPLCHLSIKFYTSPPPCRLQNYPLPHGWQMIRVVPYNMYKYLDKWRSCPGQHYLLGNATCLINCSLCPLSCTLSTALWWLSGQPSTVCLLKLLSNK